MKSGCSQSQTTLVTPETKFDMDDAVLLLRFLIATAIAFADSVRLSDILYYNITLNVVYLSDILQSARCYIRKFVFGMLAVLLVDDNGTVCIRV